MKKVSWDNPNKMHVDTDFVLFNKQSNLISTGNVMANTQFSWFIRPYKETKCNGFDFKEGELLNSDLKYFNNLPQRISDILRDKERETSYILYEFFVTKNHEKDIIGYIITDANHDHVDSLVRCGYKENTGKRMSVISWCEQYVCN